MHSQTPSFPRSSCLSTVLPDGTHLLKCDVTNSEWRGQVCLFITNHMTVCLSTCDHEMQTSIMCKEACSLHRSLSSNDHVTYCSDVPGVHRSDHDDLCPLACLQDKFTEGPVVERSTLSQFTITKNVLLCPVSRGLWGRSSRARSSASVELSLTPLGVVSHSTFVIESQVIITTPVMITIIIFTIPSFVLPVRHRA